MKDTIAVGTPVPGYCSGAFGRDSYGPRRIEAVGYDWVVARNERGQPEFVHVDNWPWFLGAIEVAIEDESKEED